MPASIAAAFEQAKKMKKSPKAKGGKGGLIHPAFPPQGAEQPSHMGSQSASPMPVQGDPYSELGGNPQQDGSMQGMGF